MIWLLLGALAVGALFCLGVKLTATVIRNFRTRRNTKLLIADMESIARNTSNKDGHYMSMSEFGNYRGKTIIGEFDPYTEDFIQVADCDVGVDANVRNVLRSHDGYVIVGD